MINTNKTDKGTEIVLVVDDKNDGVFDWTAGRGYLIANVTRQTSDIATAKFTLLCVVNESKILELERALHNAPTGNARMKPSNALEKFMKPLFRDAGIIDS